MEPDSGPPQAGSAAIPDSKADPLDNMSIGQLKKYVSAYQNLKGKYERVKIDLHETIGAKEKLEKQSGILTNENATLKSGKERLEKENGALTNESAILKSDQAVLQERVESAKQENIRKGKKVAEVEACWRESGTLIDHLTKRNASLQNQLDDVASVKDDCAAYLGRIGDLERDLAGKDSLLSNQKADKEKVKRVISEYLGNVEADRDNLARQALQRSLEESQYRAAWLEMTDSRDNAEHDRYLLAMQLANAKNERYKTQAACVRFSEQLLVAERQAAQYKQEVCDKSKAVAELSKDKKWLQDAYRSNKADLNTELISNRDLGQTLDQERKDREVEINILNEEVDRYQYLIKQKRVAYDTLRSDYERLQQKLAAHDPCNELGKVDEAAAISNKRKRPQVNGFKAGDAHILINKQLRGDCTNGPGASENIRPEQAAAHDPRLQMMSDIRHSENEEAIPSAKRRKRFVGEWQLGGSSEAHDRLVLLIRELYANYEDVEVSVRSRVLPRGVTMFVDKSKMHEIVEVDQHITEHVEEVLDPVEVQIPEERLWKLRPHLARPWVRHPKTGVLVDPSTIVAATITSAPERPLEVSDTLASPDELAGGQLSITVPSAGTVHSQAQTPASPIIDSALDPVTRAEATSGQTQKDARNAVRRQWDDDKQYVDSESLHQLHRDEQNKEKLHNVDRHVPDEPSDGLFVSPAASDGARTLITGEATDAAPCTEPVMHPDRVVLRGLEEASHGSNEDLQKIQFDPPRGPRRPSSIIPAAYREDLCSPHGPLRDCDKVPKRGWSEEHPDSRRRGRPRRQRRYGRPEYDVGSDRPRPHDVYRPVRD